MATATKMKRIVVPDDAPGTVSPRLEAMAQEVAEEVVIYRDRPEGTKELINRCKNAEAVVNILSTCYFSREVMEKCPDLRIISIWAAGVNNIDLEAARDLGITVSNTPGYGSFGVGEHTLTLMLATARKVVSIDKRVRQGEWPKDQLYELYGKTAGIIGAGPIAQRVMELCKAVGMKVNAWTLNPSPEREKKLGVKFLDLDELCRTSDALVLIIALSEKTKGIISRERLAMMKSEAVLINTGRGALVDEDALVEVLSKGKIWGAGLDVFVQEPLPQGHPLTKLDNVVLSSHVAAHTPETTEAGVRMAVENIEAFLKGKPQNVWVRGTR